MTINVKAVKSAKPVLSAEPSKSVEASKSTKSAKSTKLEKSTKAVTSKVAVNSTEVAKPIKALKSVKKDKIVVDQTYRPTEDEDFMNERQRDYFRRRLLDWKDEILRESRETLVALQTENENHPDLADRASSETDRAIELRARDRQRKLISKIDSALARIDDGSYGYCEETGEPISLRRLEARPIATLSLEAQERHERNEKVHRDD